MILWCATPYALADYRGAVRSQDGSLRDRLLAFRSAFGQSVRALGRSR
jgi:hypothetical protein